MDYKFKVEKLLRVIDGDSLEVVLSLGFATYSRKIIRIAGLDTPELNSGTMLEKRAGKFVRKQVADWLLKREAKLQVASEKWEGGGDKYGRVLGDVTTIIKTERGVPALLADPVESLRAWLLNNKLARAYDGEKKIEWDKKALEEILSKTQMELYGK